jgi:hypothetical protein
VKKETVFLDFNLSPSSECCILYFGRFPVVLSVIAAVQNNLFHRHMRCKQEEGKTECSETSANKIQMPGNNSKERIHQDCVCFSLCGQQSCCAIKGQEANTKTCACLDSL